MAVHRELSGVRGLRPGGALERFIGIAGAWPDRPAVTCGPNVVTFAQLDSLVSTIAANLRDVGARPGDVVGVCLPRGTEMVAAILGVLRTGAGYLPLDPVYPAQRTVELIVDSRAAVVLVDGTTADRVAALDGVRAVAIGAATTSASVAPTPWDPDQLAYTIYTSGSTGRPKGVDVTHGGVATLLGALDRVAGGGPVRVGWNSSMSFDASVQQWLRLCRGDTIVMLTDDERRDPEALLRVVAAAAVDELDITPSQLAVLLDHIESDPAARPLRLLIGGEAIPTPMWRRLTALDETGRTTAVNLYGPTECTVEILATAVSGPEPHLGTALAGSRVYVLGEDLAEVASGAIGELYVAGPQLARGYRHQPGATAGRFVADPFAHDGSRMYRTGDLVRRDDDGHLRYLGRADDQVKIRGHRVELAEVEAVLCAIPGVGRAHAMIRDDLGDGPSLVGYVTVVSPVGGGQLRDELAANVPDFLVPAAIVVLDAMPLTPNGKIDRGALPRPGRTDPHEPIGPAETLVAAAWQAVLGAPVGRGDDFFEIGGQSLSAISVAARLRRETGRPIPLTAVFENPILRDLAARIESVGPERTG